MTRRLRVMLGILVAVSGLALGHWLWPGPTRLPAGPIHAEMRTLHVVRIEPVSDRTVQALVAALAPHLRVKIRPTSEWVVDERHGLTWEGDLYDVDVLLARLVKITPRETVVMGVTDQAMHDDDHWWLYGKAGGRVAIISTAHLWFDDAEPDTTHPLFRTRLAKVGVHELGHSMGFPHCEEPRCVMWFSTNLSMLDYSETTFCRTCRRAYF